MGSRTFVTAVAAALSGVMTLLVAKLAAALPAIDLEIAAKGGFGNIATSTPAGRANPLGVGLGGRAGGLLRGVYGGVAFGYWFGGSERIPVLAGSTSARTATHSLMYGLEGGYTITVSDVVAVRGQVGIGNFTRTIDFISASTSSNDLYVEPGIILMVSLPWVRWFVCADANILVLIGANNGDGAPQTDVAITGDGQVGYRF
jgi:hypothetical protein